VGVVYLYHCSDFCLASCNNIANQETDDDKRVREIHWSSSPTSYIDYASHSSETRETEWMWTIPRYTQLWEKEMKTIRSKVHHLLGISTVGTNEEGWR
jgi:hypothetical protein